MSFKAKFRPVPRFKAKFHGSENLDATFSSFIVVPFTDYYEGEYTVTPTNEVQTIPIVGKTARENITVGAIPSNYGLITWNGATLTVS